MNTRGGRNAEHGSNAGPDASFDALQIPVGHESNRHN